MRKHIKRITALSLILVLAFSFLSYGYVTEASDMKDRGKSIAQLNGYSEEVWAALNDNKLEYSEIEDRVHSFNPTVTSGWESLSDSAQTLSDSLFVLDEAKKNCTGVIENIKAMPLPQADKAVMLTTANTSLKTVESVLMSSRQTYNKLKTTSENSINRELYKGEEQLASGVKQLVIAYKTLEANEVLLEKLTELYEESCQAYEALLKEGMATSTELLSARASLTGAKSSLSALTPSKTQLYNNILSLCGWSLSDNITIGDVPGADASKVSSFDPEADYEKALGNNYYMSEARSSGSSSSSAGKNIRKLTVETAKENLKVNLTDIYNEALSADKSYLGAAESLALSKELKKAADTQYSLGLTSRAQYTGSCISALQKETAYKTADLELTRAILAYEDAVNGNCSIEQKVVIL